MDDAELGMTCEQKVDHWGLTLMVPAFVAWVAISVTARPEAAGRYAGAVLELLGFFVVAYGLQEKVAQVTGRPGLRERVASWVRPAWRRIKKLFGWKPEGRTISAGIAETVSAGDSARVTVRAGPDATLDHRVEILEREIEAIRQWIRDVRQECREGRSELKEEIVDVRSDLDDVEEELEDLIRRLAVGALHWEATGLFWFVLGVVAATWPAAIPGA